MTIDVDDCPEEISAAHPSGGRYAGLWLLARVAGEPRALIRLAFTGDRMLRSEIEPHLEAVRAAAAPPTPAPPPEDLPRISVIVCSMFERLDGLRRCLESLVALDYPSFEIVLVDNRRDGGEMPDWLAAVAGVRLLHEPQPGLSAARNCGLAAISSEIAAFTDDDVVVDPGWLRAIGRRFLAHPDEVCVTGLILPAELETSAQATFEEYYGGFGPRVFQPVSHRLKHQGSRAALRSATVCELDDRGNELSTFLLYEVGHLGTGANMAFRTAALREAGGFDVRLGVGTPTHGGEDVAMFVRLIWQGHSIGYDPAALVYHSHRRNDEDLRRQVATFGTSFTATMISLALDDPRHVGAIVATLPQGVRRMGRLFRHRLRTDGEHEQPGAETSTIRGLARLELVSMTKGPAAYARSRRRARRLGR
jgi:GT2 family glycosyltransferase